MVEVRVNGETLELEPGTTVRGLLERLGKTPGAWVAVERNRVVVPRAEQAAVVLADGDVIEVVQLVGGG